MITRVMGSYNQMDLERTTSPVGSHSEGLGGLVEREPMGDHDVFDVRGTVQDVDRGLEITAFVLMGVENRRPKGDLAQNHLGAHDHRIPEDSEFDEIAAGSTGTQRGIEGRLRTHRVEHHVVAARDTDTTAERLHRTLLMFVARFDVHLESEVDENRDRGETDTAGSDHGNRRAGLQFGASHSVYRHGHRLDEGRCAGTLTVVHREHRIGIDHNAIGESSVDRPALKAGEGVDAHVGLIAPARVTVPAAPDRANGHSTTVGKATSEFVSESHRRRPKREHVNVAPADPGRLDRQEESLARGFRSLDYGDRTVVATYGAHRGIIARATRRNGDHSPRETTRSEGHLL